MNDPIRRLKTIRIRDTPAFVQHQATDPGFPVVFGKISRQLRPRFGSLINFAMSDEQQTPRLKPANKMTRIDMLHVFL